MITLATAQSCDLKDLVQKFIPESIDREIEKTTSSIYPLQNVFIRKVKNLKAPKFDLGKLMEVHGDYSTEDVGVKMERPAEEPVEAAAELPTVCTKGTGGEANKTVLFDPWGPITSPVLII
ncbi:hypothetical protein HYC85_013204 [Camellia sinensis]|uniref:40S ribosomal protein S3a n=1 Tax=Camellia sinensis TaxID=4442 RepID=A0A7J7H3Z2_CAMSI|nr:hypothetical protein HYC85_013204 [Camellia sinensis]